MVPKRLAGVAAVLVAFVGAACAAEPVRIEQGLIQGVEENGLTVYKGIPFATPPTGKLRWRAPEPGRSWSGVLAADAFRPRCMQSKNDPPLADATMPISEDCLYLNIWTPTKSAGKGLPVMVWIYGNGFLNGAGSDALYSGDNLAKKGVVVVTFNYRLGNLGFLALPGLSAESKRHASGNYGLMDMIAALKWVKRNIAAVGGDPHNVTIFGVSAGSQAVNLLMVSPRARGLFSRAIGQSGGKFKPAGSDRALPEAKGLLKDAERYGTTLVARLGVKSLAELRKLPAEAVIAAGPAFPIVDGDVIPKDAWSVFTSGAQNDVPLLVGTTSDEGDSFVSQPLSARRFVEVAHAQAGSMAERLLSVYPADSDAQAATSQRRFETDYGFGWEAWTWARMQSKKGTSPVYAYSFAYRPPYPDAPPYSSWGVPHMAELPYVFQHFATPWKWTDEDRRVGNLLSSYWVNFARTGDPNGPGLPTWEPFTHARQRMLHIGRAVAMGDVPHRAELGFVEDYVRMLRARAALSGEAASRR